MKKKSSQSAFFNVRVLIGLFVVLAGVFLALLGFGTFSNAFAQGRARPQLPYDARGLSAPYAPQLPQATSGSAGAYLARIPAAPAPQTARGGALWYNGDFNGVNGLANEENTTVTQAAVYDDFVVGDSGGWDVSSVFSNNLMTPNEPIVGADWEIRQGISEGNPGTLIASGTTSTPIVTPTGRSGFGFIEYNVEVTGLSVHLAPGTYFLNVTPSDSGTGRSFDSTTSGANCVGTPCGNNQNAFFNSTFFGFFYTSTANVGQPFDFSMGVNGTVSGGGTPTPTPTPGGCQFQVLIVYSDIAGTPSDIQNQILAEPGVTACDLFDAFSGTPTLAQLQQYNIVYAFSNNGWNNAVGMGDVLADYEDAGGVVVVSTFAWDNRGPWLLQGRWATGGYSPYDSTSTTLFSTNTANITDPGHPLMQGVSNLTAFYRNGVTLAAGAVSQAVWTDGPPAVAYKTNNGHTGVGLNAYLGVVAQPITGDWGRTIVNAGRWLLTCEGTPTPTPTPTATPCGTSKIYNIAGFNLGGQSTTTRIYDIAADTWSTGAPIPEPTGLSDYAVGYWNGVIYAAGGYNGSGLGLTTLRAYDIAGNSWSTLASMPTGVFLPGFGVINGKLYVASGNTGFGEVPNLQIYDIATNTWSAGAPIPTPVTGPGSAVFDGHLYVFGGGAPFPSLTTITQIYDPISDSWSSGPNMNLARVWFYGGALDDTSIDAPGGDQTVGIPGSAHELFTGAWAVKAALPFNSRGPFVVSDGTYYYIGGGYDGSTVHTDTLRYDPVANSFTTLAPAPDPHFLSQAVIVTNPCPSEIQLRAKKDRVHQRVVVRLEWRGATSDNVDIYRNGVVIATVPNTGSWGADVLRNPGTYTYKVCEAGTASCSNEVSVTIP